MSVLKRCLLGIKVDFPFITSMVSMQASTDSGFTCYIYPQCHIQSVILWNMQGWVNSEIRIGIEIGIEIDFWSAKVIGIGTDLKVIRIGIKN